MSIVQCGQCPICKTYVPIPADILKNVMPAPAVVPAAIPYGGNADTVLTYRPNPGHHPPIQPGLIAPSVSIH